MLSQYPERLQRVKPPQNHILKNFRILYYLSRLSCLNCFDLPSDRDRKLKLNIFHLVLSGSYITFTYANSFFNIKNNIHFSVTESIIINFGFFATNIFAACQIATFIMLDIMNRHKLWDILTDCYDFDQQVNFSIIPF